MTANIPINVWYSGNDSNAMNEHMQQCKRGAIYRKKLDNNWDDYKDEETIIIDGLNVPYDYSMNATLISLAKRNPFNVETLTGTKAVNPKAFFVMTDDTIDYLFAMKDYKTFEIFNLSVAQVVCQT